MDKSCSWCNGPLGMEDKWDGMHPSCKCAYDAKCAENEARLADRSRAGWPFESEEAKRAWANEHYNSVEYYERRKAEIARRHPILEKYPTKELYMAREREPFGPPTSEADIELTPEMLNVLDSFTYDSMKESYEHDVNFVAEYEAGIRSRWNDNGIEYYTPDGTVIRTYKKGDKKKK